MLRTRVVTALILLALFIGALFYLSQAAWAALVLALTVVAAQEWARLAGFGPAGKRIFVALTFALGLVAIFISNHFQGWGKDASRAVFAAALLFWICVAPIWIRLRWRLRAPLVMAAVGWILLLPTLLALIELREQSPWVLLAMAGLVWIADSAAYFAGMAFGRRRLAPSISPGKTWEGVAGALLAVTLYAALLLALVRLVSPQLFPFAPAATWVLWVSAFLAMAALSIVGDLFESWMKRQAGIKDSGSIFPGHGGMLDRIDALTASLPFAAFIFAR